MLSTFSNLSKFAPSLFNSTMSNRMKSQVVGRLLLVAIPIVLFIVMGYDLSHVTSVVTKHAKMLHEKLTTPVDLNPSRRSNPSAAGHLPPALQGVTKGAACRVQFVFAGSKYDYNNFPLLQTWIRYADPKCPIEFLRPNHPFLVQLTTAESRMFYNSAFLPILQADMLKLFSLFYLGGVVVDLDVEAIKPFPQAWSGIDNSLASCNVVVGIEANCYDDECVKTMVRKGQIQNWAMFARQPRSQFMGELLEFVVAKYESMAPLDKDVSVQEVAGSGPITDFVILYGNFSQPHYQIQTTPSGGTLETDPTSVLRIRKHHEEICIVGAAYTGGGCSGYAECLIAHHYEGSWRSSS
ncbi:hypothetical protein AeRB84_013536 [Aphanomyces euteiches]|nr:hypothetical protein AeRB84_013536 [Aphanomyces euteiches]